MTLVFVLRAAIVQRELHDMYILVRPIHLLSVSTCDNCVSQCVSVIFTAVFAFAQYDIVSPTWRWRGVCVSQIWTSLH